MKRDLVQVVFSLFIVTTSATAMAEEPHQWKTATVISQNIGRSVMGECSDQVGGGSAAAPTNRKSNTVVVDIGRHRYSLQELTGGSDRNHFIVLTGHYGVAHDQVKFYRAGQLFVVLDNQGEKHEFCLLHATKFQ